MSLRWPVPCSDRHYSPDRILAPVVLIAVLCVISVGSLALAADNASVNASEDSSPFREMLQHGRYAELIEKISVQDAETDGERVGLVQLLSEALQQIGATDRALSVVETELESSPDQAGLWARAAELRLSRGEFKQAQRAIDEALDRDSQNPEARLVEARLLTETGQIDAALDAYRWFIRHYNRTQPTDAKTLVAIGRGAAVYARWQGVPGIYKFIVNTICVDALRDDANCWQASVLSGELFLEKYNKSQAMEEFHAALKINPNCADAFVGLASAGLQDREYDLAEQFADRALSLNASHLGALLVKIDIALQTKDPADADEFLDRAVQLAPAHQEVLAREVGRRLIEGPEIDVSAFGELQPVVGPDAIELFAEMPEVAKAFATISQVNSRPGVFLHEIAKILEGHRRYGAAEAFYRWAIACVPHLPEPQTALGMLCMRTGRLEEARQILDGAFRADPFHVRVSNMRKVLGVLSEYETIATDHFIVRIAASQRVLGEEMAAYLEEIYPELTARFGFEPPTRTQFEIFSDSRDQPAHAWFSARMTGLPWIQTVGASTGMIVALASPADVEQPFNWARVLKHEFVHILTLQQTRFRISHWYTEALAVDAEGIDLLDDWRRLLLERVPRGEVFTLDDIDTGFQRPRGPDDWHLAYCQSRLYARHLERVAGAKIHAKLLSALTAGKTLKEAIPEATGLSLVEFEEGYQARLDELVEEFRQDWGPTSPTLDDARKRLSREPENADAHAELAWVLQSWGEHAEAEEAIAKCLELDAGHGLGAALLVRDRIRRRDLPGALEALAAADRDGCVHPLLVQTAGRLALYRDEYDEAVSWLRPAVKCYPLRTDFMRMLAEGLKEESDSLEEQRRLLKAIAERDPDDVVARKRLMRLAVDRGENEAVLKWGTEALWIDAFDTDIHRHVAQAAAVLSRGPRLERSVHALIAMEADEVSDRVLLARLLKDRGERAEAMKHLSIAVQRDPTHREAATLLKQLDRGL